MQTLNMFKAQPVGDKQIQSIQIVLNAQLPDLDEQDFKREAKILAEVLCERLPGGTLDQLIVQLLRHKASLLAVSHTIE